VVLRWRPLRKAVRLHPRPTESKKLKTKFTACRDGGSRDVASLAAAVRHIFAHGHLGATTSDISPSRMARACNGLCDFLIGFMEADFESRIVGYYGRVKAGGEAI
jgi:hypothetical protein